MATKKQKRLRGFEKAERDLAESKRLGLEAQRRDHEDRARSLKNAHDFHAKRGIFSMNCKHCQEEA